MSKAIPTTLSAALSALVNQDCVRWGEHERAASAQLHGRRTLGLALNELANRALLHRGASWLGEYTDEPALRAASQRVLTGADRHWLRQGYDDAAYHAALCDVEEGLRQGNFSAREIAGMFAGGTIDRYIKTWGVPGDIDAAAYRASVRSILAARFPAARPRGRPRSDRYVRIVTRVSEVDAARIRACAKARGLTLGELLVSAVGEDK